MYLTSVDYAVARSLVVPKLLACDIPAMVLFLLPVSARNKITGTIPDVLKRLTKLTRLSLGGNPMHGAIPNWLGALTGLELLMLGAMTRKLSDRHKGVQLGSTLCTTVQYVVYLAFLAGQVCRLATC